jgi:Flp pilus assembly protein TadD
VTAALLLAAALAAVDPCAPVEPASTPDPVAAAEYRAVAEAEQSTGAPETAAAAWRRAASLAPDDGRAREALAALCSADKGAPAASDPQREAIRLLDAGRYREAAELLKRARTTPPGPDASLLEGICRYELGEDAEAARLLREAELEADYRETARLYLGLVALRAGSATEAASLFDSAAGNPSLASLAGDLARSARWDGPVVFSLLTEAGWDSNVGLVGTGSGGGGLASSGDAIAGLSAVLLGRPFGANGLFLRGAGALQQYARLDAYDFTSWEVAGGWRHWRSGTGITGEYAFADRTLGGDRYLATHRLLVAGAVGLGPVELAGSWWGRWENYASTYDDWSGFAQRAEGRASVALGSRARLGATWGWGRDDTALEAKGWTEQGPRLDLRLALGPAARLTVEAGGALREYHAWDSDYTNLQVGERLVERIVDGAAAFEWDLGRRTTLRFSLLARWSDANDDALDYKKLVPSAAIGVMITP